MSTDAICRAAGVRKGSLYHAFPSKADVLAACLEKVWQDDWSDVQAIYDRADTPENKFRSHLEWFCGSQRRLLAKQGMVLGTFDMALGVSIPDQVWTAMRKHQGEHFARVRTSIIEVLGLDDSQDAHATWIAETVLQLFSGTMVRARLANDLAPLETLPETVFRLIRAVRSPALVQSGLSL